MVLEEHKKKNDGKGIAFNIGHFFPFLMVWAGDGFLKLWGRFGLEIQILASLGGG